jgi:hypothetical protein
VSGDRRVDPRTGGVLVLASDGLTVLRTDGGSARIPAPDGYSLSHFADGITVVGRGEAQVEGWRDWHFEPDLEAGLLRRRGPAY